MPPGLRRDVTTVGRSPPSKVRCVLASRKRGRHLAQSAGKRGRRELLSNRSSTRVEVPVRFRLLRCGFAPRFATDYVCESGCPVTGRYLTTGGLAELSKQLPPRDLAVLEDVARLRFVTGRQLQRLHFHEAADSAADGRAARRSLLRLVGLGLLDRLERRVGGVRRGSAGFVYCLAPHGQRLAMVRGWLPEQRRRRSTTHGMLFVRHTLAVAEVHVRVVEGDRAQRFELLELTSEPSCWRSYVGLGGQRETLKPDSFVRLGNGPYEDSFFIEVDRGTEGSRAIEGQLRRYAAYQSSGAEQATHGVFPRVLWLAPDARRVAAIVDAAARLPAEHWRLFQVVRFDQAIDALTGENHNNQPVHERERL